jgi:uncharacterized membrane protein
MWLADHLNIIDWIALIVFLLSWFGYGYFWNERSKSPTALSYAINAQRRQWFKEVVAREVRIADTQIINIHQQAALFFASTSILVIGLLITALSSVTEHPEWLKVLPMFQSTTIHFISLKVLGLIVIYIYAFFKFAWSIRLNNYLSIIIGAVPEDINKTETLAKYASAGASLSQIVGMHFTMGIRAYFFSLAFLGWFIHPIAFMMATALVLWIIYRRDSLSRASKILLDLIDHKESNSN